MERSQPCRTEYNFTNDLGMRYIIGANRTTILGEVRGQITGSQCGGPSPFPWLSAFGQPGVDKFTLLMMRHARRPPLPLGLLVGVLIVDHWLF